MKSRDLIQNEIRVLRVQSGDSEAFRDLVDAWQEKLWRHAYHLIGDEEAAWDVVQETWIAVVKGIRQLQDPAAFPKWVYRIAGGKSVDWIRKRQSQRRLSDSLVLERETDSESAACADLRSALERLSGDQRAILSLRYTEGLSTLEIAEILEIAEGTVKSRLHNAREKLRKLMERE